ncbi:hypothetical protein Csa_001190, partial [Cucumis sativus]
MGESRDIEVDILTAVSTAKKRGHIFYNFSILFSLLIQIRILSHGGFSLLVLSISLHPHTSFLHFCVFV